MSNLKPHNDYILVEKDEVTETPGGIILPDIAREGSCVAYVKNVGTGKTEDGEYKKFQVKPGDKILIQKNAGIEVGLDNENEYLIKEDNIVSFLKERSE